MKGIICFSDKTSKMKKNLCTPRLFPGKGYSCCHHTDLLDWVGDKLFIIIQTVVIRFFKFAQVYLRTNEA